MIKKVLITTTALITLFGCKETDESSDTDSNSTSDVKTDTTMSDTAIDARENFDELFANVPSPYVMSRMLETSGVKADPELLHNPAQASEYKSQRALGLNMGIYSVDLNYSHVCELPMDEIKYMSAILSIADELGLNKIFDKDMLAEMRNNIDDRPKVLSIITDTYATLESYLQEERREEIAAYMMAGGVVEVIYLGTHTAGSNEVLLQAIADQSSGIRAIVQIIERLGETYQDEEVIRDLTSLLDIFDRMETVGTTGTVVREDDGSVTLGESPRKLLTPALAEELRKLSIKIRNRYTNS